MAGASLPVLASIQVGVIVFPYFQDRKDDYGQRLVATHIYRKLDGKNWSMIFGSAPELVIALNKGPKHRCRDLMRGFPACSIDLRRKDVLYENVTSGTITKEHAFEVFCYNIAGVANMEMNTQQVRLFIYFCLPGEPIALTHDVLEAEHRKVQNRGECTIIVGYYCQAVGKEDLEKPTLDLIREFRERGPYYLFIPLRREDKSPSATFTELETHIKGCIRRYKVASTL